MRQRHHRYHSKTLPATTDAAATSGTQPPAAGPGSPTFVSIPGELKPVCAQSAFGGLLAQRWRDRSSAHSPVRLGYGQTLLFTYFASFAAQTPVVCTLGAGADLNTQSLRYSRASTQICQVPGRQTLGSGTYALGGVRSRGRAPGYGRRLLRLYFCLQTRAGHGPTTAGASAQLSGS